ncbi:UDP-galactopyranose mutase [Desulfosarcina sp. OttesenSCG-928-A07]|nr:UDP-galactopyranose mutase [Desulfosarcina sp. OttesenSCG-928-G17]MDL2330242.1 UDP-galactopyranose mutase [Desulfosarcina sp. OttesenSCG-928-A07]
MNIFFVGAGLWSSVLAERITTICKVPVTIFERRSHHGGNCHSSMDKDTGIEFHHYGTHIFHTTIKKVWEYVRKFSDFTPYRHKVLTVHADDVYAMPINLGTINQFYKKKFTPIEAILFMQSEIQRDAVASPENFEEKAISLIGRPLYEAFIKGYTHKQWEHDPRDLPSDIITRLPVRYNYNTDYFNDHWQGIPLYGYDSLFENLLSNPLINIEYNKDFKNIMDEIPSDSLIIYTGMPDELYNYKFGELEWRSLYFEWEALPVQDYQGTSVMNYADTTVPYTRIHEFKHLHPERLTPFASEKTIICREFSHAWHPGEEAYYPVNNKRNNDIYARYREEAERSSNIILGGRLGKYTYFDMDKCIEDALNTFDSILRRLG